MAAGSTYTPIATTTLGSTASTISFTSIPQTYTDLVIVSSVRGDISGDYRVRWGNGSYDSGTNYSVTGMWNRLATNDYGSANSANYAWMRLSAFTYGVPSATSTFGTNVAHIMNYSNTTTYKTVLSRSSDTGAGNYDGTETIVGLWRNTAAINQMQFYILANTGTFQIGTTITLYGIAAA